jgi:hypothetical protein
MNLSLIALFGLWTQFFQSSLLPAEKAIAPHPTNLLRVRLRSAAAYSPDARTSLPLRYRA